MINNSKACTSLVFYSSVSDELLPPYVVYQAQNIYTNCIGRGREVPVIHVASQDGLIVKYLTNSLDVLSFQLQNVTRYWF